jgi:hypothetical protein
MAVTSTPMAGSGRSRGQAKPPRRAARTASGRRRRDHGGAVGYLVGQENRGLEYMFVMMNAARFGVGIQGIAISEASYQKAVEYARERVQSRVLARGIAVIARGHEIGLVIASAIDPAHDMVQGQAGRSDITSATVHARDPVPGVDGPALTATDPAPAAPALALGPARVLCLGHE